MTRKSLAPIVSLISVQLLATDLPLLQTDFENFASGASMLLTQGEVDAYLYGNEPSLFTVDDPNIQGVTTQPAFNPTKVGYLGGLQQQAPELGPEGGFYAIAAYQSQPMETSEFFARNLRKEGFKSFSASIDFYIERGSSSVPQTIAIFLYDAVDMENPSTGLAYAGIYIQEDGSIVLHDNLLMFAPVTSPIIVLPETPYRLTYRVDYSTNHWWASLTQIQSGSVEIIANKRSHPAGGFINPNGVLDIALETPSARGADWGDDRVYFDNFVTYISQSHAEELTMSITPPSNGKFQLSIPTLPGQYYQLLRGNSINSLIPSGPLIQGTGEVLIEAINIDQSQEFFKILQTATAVSDSENKTGDDNS